MFVGSVDCVLGFTLPTWKCSVRRISCPFVLTMLERLGQLYYVQRIYFVLRNVEFLLG